MFKLLITKMKVHKRTMKIEEIHDPEEGSSYWNDVVYVNLAFYEESGIGISSRKYFYIDETGNIKMKLKSLTGSIFHEFCHALHDVSGTEKASNVWCVDETHFAKTWGNDEELRTITCFYNDPICDHCFDFCQSILKNEPFYPRYSHDGYVGEDEQTKSDLEDLYNCISVSKNFMDGWREYVIQEI
ncbi:hypothetical protein FACS189449_12550 [Alphaproteobacteria bacterium]|nr:hypothetical protein FACS189449_12550 [Alphaproteobacteria bacterium]